ncbi:MAG: peroxiredoxin [Candidatus Vogelbacteria bacterium CG10_big_fil_rev_8_21_14_0_10_45_14]|uniref:Peroxiredoxin n=1 Tax=Candidatus Vogelbacteria bacterium CG10_big_fil_rev_8_21_14_0_10_45_14 TaxID=1975042 RepID=A0A2H0RIS4_9BACT|nr:MAG: peroxiredoxin [Candidatus Vogelbacteria bacterium CG10_big_fil_rev_8_21_14_0_10_45_14]
MYEDFLETVRINDEVPEFELDAYHNGKISKWSTKSAKGKWLVVIFYPADFTFVCPTELEETARLYKDFKKAGAEVVSVSTDTAFVHKAWHDHSPAIKKVDFPMLADPAGKISRMFGVYIEDEGLDLRGTFVIDPKGMLKTMEIHDNSIGRNIEETLRKIIAASYVYSHKGEVCPVSWSPGKKTLKPSEKLVGQI